MSNSLAIAAVTSTLRYVLERALEATHPGPVGGAGVTTLRPNQLTDTTLVTTPGINIYLYDVRPNHAWNLTDLPTRGRDGSFTRRPVAALDLHYLLTCYGEDESLDAQRLLGRAVLALAVTPVLTRDVVTAAIDLYAPEVPTAFLDAADLADQLERIKVAPYALTVEEMSRLWGTFGTPHQLSQTYVATAALIEADVTPRRALPVRQRGVSVVAGGPAVLTALRTDPPGGAATTGDVVELTGAGLTARPGQLTRIRVGPATLAPGPAPTAQRLTVTLDTAVPAGLHAVRVVHLTPASAGAPQRTTGTSNTLPLLVRPTVTVHSGPPDIVLRLDPPLIAGQRATVLLTRLAPGPVDAPDTVAVRFGPVAPGSPPQPEIELAADDVPAGEWLVRVQVDGVDSLAELVGEVYGAPALTVP